MNFYRGYKQSQEENNTVEPLYKSPVGLYSPALQYTRGGGGATAAAAAATAVAVQ